MARELDADALRTLEAAVDAAPTSVALGLQLMHGLLAAARIEDARRRNDTLVAVAPDDPEVLTLAAGVAKTDGDADRADRLLRLAAALGNATQLSTGADLQPPHVRGATQSPCRSSDGTTATATMRISSGPT